MKYVPRSPWFRAALVLPPLVAVVVLLWWRGPDWGLVARAFNLVDWAWIVFAIALNLVSVLVRSLAWRLTIDQALDPPHPRFDQVFSAFSIGLLGERGAARAGSGSSRASPSCGVTSLTAPGRPALSSARSSHTGSSTSFRRRCSFSTSSRRRRSRTGRSASLMIVLVVGGLLFTLAVATAKRGRRHPSSRAPARCGDFS